MESRFHTGRRLARLVAERTGRPELGHDADVVARVLPFKVSAHVADVLVDWGRAPDDPLYRLVMPSGPLFAALPAVRRMCLRRFRRPSVIGPRSGRFRPIAIR